jgi:hypothetical protein
MIFIEKRNISKWPEIEKAALTCGLIRHCKRYKWQRARFIQ